MRKSALLLVSVAISLCASARQYYAGGSLGVWHSTTAGSTSVEVAPTFGVYFNNMNWSAGAVMRYKHDSVDGFTSNVFSIAPSVRYCYFSKGLLTAFVDGGVSYGVGKTKYDGQDYGNAVTWDAGFRPGLSIELAKNISIEAHVGFLGYQGANRVADAAGYEKGYGFDFSGDNLTFGFTYTF
jgi:hypothetical protein